MNPVAVMDIVLIKYVSDRHPVFIRSPGNCGRKTVIPQQMVPVKDAECDICISYIYCKKHFNILSNILGKRLMEGHYLEIGFY